jgi:hypothetical protein
VDIVGWDLYRGFFGTTLEGRHSIMRGMEV